MTNSCVDCDNNMPSPQRLILKSATAAITFCAIFVAGFFPTLLGLHKRWSAWTESYSHGYLLLGVALYLYFDSREEAPSWLPDARRYSIAMLAAFSLLWLLTYVGGIGALQQVMVVLIAAALFASLLDRTRLWRALLSLGLLTLAIPIWDELLVKSLQTTATTVSGWAVSHLFGIPASIDNFHISIPAGTFEIASGCAGLVFLLSAIALGIVYGQFFLVKSSARVAAIFVAAALGICLNWIRIISLILIGQYSHMQHSLITEGHLLYGWYLFSGMLATVLLISHFVVTPQNKIIPSQAIALECSWRRLIAVALALTCGPLTLAGLRAGIYDHREITPSAAKISPYLKQSTSNLRGFISPAINSTYSYALEPELTISFVYYPNSLGAGKLIGQSNQLFLPEEHIVDETVLAPSATLPARRQLHLNRDVEYLALKSTTQRAYLIWDWYEIGGTSAATASQGKWQQLKQTLQGHLEGFYIRFTIPCSEYNCVAEEQILAQHAPAIYRDVRPELDRIRYSR